MEEITWEVVLRIKICVFLVRLRIGVEGTIPNSLAKLNFRVPGIIGRRQSFSPDCGGTRSLFIFH